MPSAQIVATARSTASRPLAGIAAAESAAEIAKLQHSVSALDELFDFRFGFVQLDGCLSEEIDAFLEQDERCVEVEAVAFKLGDDLFKAVEVRFEGHGYNLSRVERVRLLPWEPGD